MPPKPKLGISLSDVRKILELAQAPALKDKQVEFLRAGIENMAAMRRSLAPIPDLAGFHDGKAAAAVALLREVIPRVRQWRGMSDEGDRALAALQEALFLAREHLRPPRSASSRPWHAYATNLAQAYRFACDRSSGCTAIAMGISDDSPLVKFVTAALAKIMETPSPATCEAVSMHLKRWQRSRATELSAYAEREKIKAQALDTREMMVAAAALRDCDHEGEV